MVVAPVPTTAMVMATSGACKKNNIITNNSVFRERYIKDCNNVFARINSIDAMMIMIRNIWRIIFSPRGF